ncbi:MAG: glycoside hydrolase family 88 protein [Candidatus Omnitrophica bacterium]|nr:glycoside hydrolase family 88 protein [Candidatus Omnitrophota bacterium]
MDKNLGLCKDWILNSGIQSEIGGFYSWYDLERKTYSYLYSEITGYGITTLLLLNSLYNKKLYVDRAEKAAAWIIKSAMHDCGGVRTRLYKDDKKADIGYSFSGARIFSFDTGIVLYGMANLYRVTDKKKYLNAALRLADFLLDKMQKEDGSLAPIYDANIDEVIEPSDKWSNQSGAFHAKVALGLVDLFKLTEDKRYKEAAIRLCEYAVSTQDKSGRFITNRAAKTTHIHPHSYATEGLWYTGTVFNIPGFISSAKKATEWTFVHVFSSGISELYEPSTERFNDFQRSDILAQALRLGIIFSFKNKIGLLKSALLKYQLVESSSAQKGGFLYSKEDKHVNSWCSMFAFQALAFCKDNKSAKAQIFI